MSFDDPEFVDFFSGNRNRPEHLYPSEARFLPELSADAESVLDVGCAAGGFVSIWRAYNSRIRYVGVDVSATLIGAARRLHPGETFLVGDAATGIDLEDGVADVVSALGWLHWEPRYPDALRELWRLAGNALFFDVRLHDGTADIVGSQSIPGGKTPYVCVPWSKLARLMVELRPSSIRAYGYLGAPADTVAGMPAELCFATFVLGRGDTPLELELDLPLDWPTQLASTTNGGTTA